MPSACGNGVSPAASPAPQPSAANYYVDAAAGNDANPGTSAALAWKSLSKVNATAFGPGDKILFTSGSSFTGQLSPKGSGAKAHPIVIGKYDGDAKPIVDGAGTVEDVLVLKNQQYWEVQDLELTNTGKDPAERRGVHVVAENFGDVHHIYLRSLTIHDVNGVDSDKVKGGIQYSAIGDTKPSRFVDLRIGDNHISHVDRSGIFGWSTHWVRSKWYPSLGVIVRNNVLDDIGGDGIVVVATDGALVESNVVGSANQRSEGYNVGIWPWSADNTVIQYNEVYGTRDQHDCEGFDSDWNSRNTIIQYNYSHGNDGGFPLICDDGSQNPSDSAGNIGTIVRYNISQNDHHRGINLAGPIKNTLIYNNTIYVGKGEDVSVVLHSDWNGWADQRSYFNNIFYADGAGRFTYGTSRGDDGAYGVAPGPGKSTNNLYDANVYYNLPAQTDAHALTSDLLLTDPGGAGTGLKTLSGYRLRSGSPARESGKTMDNSGGRDFFSTVVPQCGGADRGAVESTDCRSSQ